MSTVRVASGLQAAIGRAIVGASLVALIGCGGDRSETAGGEAGTEAVTALDYEVTPERYDQWLAAQRALDAIPGLPAPPKIDPLRLTQTDLNRAVAYLEGDSRARAALARAGISARDYVLTTVALDQALVAAAAGDPAPPPAGAVGPGAPAAAPPPGRATGATRSAPARTEPRPASGQSASTARRDTAAGPAQPRIAGAPARNVELVRRNRADVVRVLRTMRFRISESAAGDLAGGDTTVTRSDSVAVGKDVTVKWDVTVRRRRDTTKAARPATASDSVRRDSTNHDSTGPR